MIIKGNRHNNGAKLARYMSTGHRQKGERAELHELRGFDEVDNIVDAFRDVEILAQGTKAEYALFHVQVRLPEQDSLARQKWEHTADRIEKTLGLIGQPRAIYFHVNERTGEEHMHIAFSLIDSETMTAKALPFFKFRLKALSRVLEREFGITQVKNERDGPIKYAAKKNEQQQAQRLGIDKDEIRNTIRACWDESDSGRSFEAALEQEGLMLTRGDRRNLVVVDYAGGIHALGKRILDVNKQAILDRLGDLSLEALPSVEQAQSLVRIIEQQHEREKQPPNWNRDRANATWEETVINAAISHEKTARQFVDPKPGKETRAGGIDKRQKETVRPERGSAADIWTALQHSDSAPAFVAALQEKGIVLSAVTDDEARRSHIAAAYPKAIGNFVPEYRVGEIVAVTERGQVYSLNRRTAGKDRDEIEAFLAPLDRGQFQGIEATQTMLQRRLDEKHWPIYVPAPKPPKTLLFGLTLRDSPNPSLENQFAGAARSRTGPERPETMPEDLRGHAAQIWKAYNLRVHVQKQRRLDPHGKVEEFEVPIQIKGARDPHHFSAVLEAKGMVLAKTSKQEAERSQAEADHWKKHGEARPIYRDGEFVVITSRGDIYQLNRRTTGHSPADVQRFLNKVEWKGISGITGTKQLIQARADKRTHERQTFRDGINAARMDRATRMKDWAPDFGSTKSAGTKISRAVSSLGKPLDFAANAVESLFAPKLTPRQKHEGERSNSERQADTERSIDFSKFTADRAQQRNNDQEERAARDRERENERDR